MLAAAAACCWSDPAIPPGLVMAQGLSPAPIMPAACAACAWAAVAHDIVPAPFPVLACGPMSASIATAPPPAPAPRLPACCRCRGEGAGRGDTDDVPPLPAPEGVPLALPPLAQSTRSVSQKSGSQSPGSGPPSLLRVAIPPPRVPVRPGESVAMADPARCVLAAAAAWWCACGWCPAACACSCGPLWPPGPCVSVMSACDPPWTRAPLSEEDVGTAVALPLWCCTRKGRPPLLLPPALLPCGMCPCGCGCCVPAMPHAIPEGPVGGLPAAP
mmetsp:Transcript_1007/g.2757  ORF Transcript_1007/g.2757 Transcript_1007/m.2757 type:complete len:272 (-) Transcript_1007:396-1211(-)